MADNRYGKEYEVQLTSEAVFRIFLKAMLMRNEEVASEQQAVSQSASQLLALIESKAEVNDVREQLQTGRWKMQLDLKSALGGDPQADDIMQVLDAEFPNPAAGVWDMETICQRFSLPYSETVEGWESLLRSIDETFQKISALEEQSSNLTAQLSAVLKDAATTRSEFDEAKQAVTNAQENLRKTQQALNDANDAQETIRSEAAQKDKTIQRQSARIVAIESALVDFASDAYQMQIMPNESAEQIIQRMRDAKKDAEARDTTGYGLAVLRSIARKCEIENPNALSQEELVQQICDVVDTRLIPKGMRIERRTR